MPAPTRITPITGKVQGAERVLVVQAIANMAAPSLATELEVSTSLWVESFWRDFAPTGSQETGTAPRRIFTRQQLPSLGAGSWEIPELRYVWRPSEAVSTNNNKAYATLTEGLEVYVMRRSDKDDAIALAAAQFVDIYHLRLGIQFPDRSGDGSDQFAEYEIKQAVELLEQPKLHVAIAT